MEGCGRLWKVVESCERLWKVVKCHRNYQLGKFRRGQELHILYLPVWPVQRCYVQCCYGNLCVLQPSLRAITITILNYHHHNVSPSPPLLTTPLCVTTTTMTHPPWLTTMTYLRIRDGLYSFYHVVLVSVQQPVLSSHKVVVDARKAQALPSRGPPVTHPVTKYLLCRCGCYESGGGCWWWLLW